MHTALRVRQFVAHDLWTMDLDVVPRIQCLAFHALRLVIAVAVEFRFRFLDARAAGLVYTTLLSLVPFLAVMFSVLTAFGGHHQIAPLLNQVFEPLGPKGAEATSHILGFVDNLKVGVLGTVGVAGLFYATYAMIDKIEQALKAIWRVKQGRTWARKFTDYLSVVLVGPVLIFTAVRLLASVQNHALVDRIRDIHFAVLALFLLWLYVGWLIILLGAQVSFFIQHPAAYRAQFLWQRDTPAIRERLVLEILTRVGRRHMRGPMRPADLANELGLPPALLEDCLAKLLDQGLLARMGGPEGIGLVKPPELMALGDVLMLIHKGQDANFGSSNKPGEQIDALLRRRDATVADSLESMTLHSLIVKDNEKANTPNTPVRS